MIRTSKGISQKELSERMNVTTPLICMWEKEKQGMSLKSFLKLSKALGVSTDDLNPYNEFKIIV